MRDVEFVCSYERTTYRAASAEDGLAGKVGLRFDSDRVTGVLNKGFGKIRCSTVFADDPTVVKDNHDGTSEVVHVHYDEVAAGEVLLRYSPKLVRSSTWGDAVFMRKKRDPLFGGGRCFAGFGSFGQPDPLHLNGWDAEWYLQSPYSTNTTCQIDEWDDKKIVVAVDLREGTSHVEKRVQFRRQGSVPVVEKISEWFRKPGSTSVIHSQGFDFVECHGGPVPRIVRCVDENADPRYPKMKWFVNEWRSRDLGQRAPPQKIFLFRFAARRELSAPEIPNWYSKMGSSISTK